MEVKNVDNNSSTFRNWLAKPKSIVISILVLFILIASIVIFLVHQQYKNTGANLLSADKNYANLVARSIAEHNNDILEVIASHAQKQSFIDAAKKKDVTEARRQLALLKKTTDFNRAIITDNAGIVRANFPASPVGSILSYRDWYKATSVKLKPHISDAFQVMIGDNPLVVAFSVPFFDEKRKPLGILTLYKKLNFITESAKRASLTQHTVAYVIDQAGNILFGTKSDFQEKITAYSLFPVVQKTLSENKTQIEIRNPESNTETGYLSIAKVEGAGWLIIVQRNYQNNLQPQQPSSPTTIIVFSFLLFILLSLGLIYFRKIIEIKNTNEQLPIEIKLPEEGKKIEEETQKLPETNGHHPNIPLIVWDHDLIIVRFDHTFEEMTGWSKEEVLGKKIDVLFPENSKKESLDRISTTAKSEKTEVLEVPILHSDGKIALTHGHYITARKQMDQDISILNGKLEKRVLERTATLESANRQLEAFSYSISHALLQPLQTIETLCDILEKSNEKTDDHKNNYLATMHKEIKRLGQLIEDMMKLTRLNRTEIKRQSIDASKIVGDIMEIYRQKFPDREVAVTIEKDILIESDELLLKIALENLIDNAWKFTVLKERAMIKFGTILKDGKTTLFIRDNGVGFDMSHINKLFSAFQHIDKGTDFSGRGIGLATVKRIVERHGGEIWAESKPDKGATFYFTLTQ